MNNKTILFLVCLCLFISINIKAQNLQLEYAHCSGCIQAVSDDPLDTLHQYDPNRAYTLGDIESDFDMRRADGDSRWHKGIDFRNHGAGPDQQRGDAVISPMPIISYGPSIWVVALTCKVTPAMPSAFPVPTVRAMLYSTCRPWLEVFRPE